MITSIRPGLPSATAGGRRQSAPSRDDAAADDNAVGAKPETGRAVVAIEPTMRSEPRRRSSWRLRSNPALIAQLIATREGLPQTRAKRRAEPVEAVAAYIETDRRPLYVAPGTRFSVAV
ncbi:MAG: hypothetical protein C0606_10470 [Hyphomicrobiales bacterium]|nr:MAG: hypothetical protein C0606_10470 [Hyphomicrobiales bacterium]